MAEETVERRQERKGKTRLLVVLVVAAVLLTAFVPAIGLAKGNKTYFSGTECFRKTLDLGTMTELGNGTVHIVGLRQVYRDKTDDPRTTGDAYVVIDAILDLNTGWGQFSATSELVNKQGSWSGHATGRVDNWLHSIHGVAHGSGAYEGLVGYWTLSQSDPDGCFDVSGYLVETGAGE
jgi:hypothetical protein